MKPETADLENYLIRTHALIGSLSTWTDRFAEELEAVHPDNRKSALNLLHYVAARSADLETWQREMRDMGLPAYAHAESHVLDSLVSFRELLELRLGREASPAPSKVLRHRGAEKRRRRNNKALFGSKSKGRHTRIMVTIPVEAAGDADLARDLVRAGMNCARINCAHDGPEEWMAMIRHVREAAAEQGRKVRIMMDLGGPKLRTGPVEVGPQVVRIRPDRDDLGRSIKPAPVRIGTAPQDPWDRRPEPYVRVDRQLFSAAEPGGEIRFEDSRGKSCRIVLGASDGEEFSGQCNQSCYLPSGTDLTLWGPDGNERLTSAVAELLPREQALILRPGDLLHIDGDPAPGTNARYDEQGNLTAPARISCLMPEIFPDVSPGDRIMFDDGKIVGQVAQADAASLVVRITHAGEEGTRLRADKGINLPDTVLSIGGLTAKDRADLLFVALHADALNFSFVNRESDMDDLADELQKCGGEHLGVVLKIETREAYRNLPRLLMRALRHKPVGVMVARGDLAIELGWEEVSAAQEEILRVCEAAHVPVVWATQVLETLARKGVPIRAEVTDAALSQRADCVMLNKGRFTNEAVNLLNRILRRMQRLQERNSVVRPAWRDAEDLRMG